MWKIIAVVSVFYGGDLSSVQTGSTKDYFFLRFFQYMASFVKDCGEVAKVFLNFAALLSILCGPARA